MLKIYTTSDCLRDLVSSCISGSFNDWQKIMLRTKVIYDGDELYDVDYGNDELPEDVIAFRALQRNENDFELDTSGYIKSILSNPEKVLDHPDSVFLLDIEEEYAKDITDKYGVICHSFKNIGYCELSQTGYDRRINRPKKSEEEQEETATKIENWADILDPNRILPSNSMILIDRNYFSNVDYTTGKLFAFTDLPKFLDAFLPKSLSCSYDVLLIFDKGDYIDKKGKKHDRYGLYQDKKGHVIKDGFTLEGLKVGLKEIVDSLKRPYTINIEYLPVDGDACFSKDKLKYNPHLDTHDRKIVTSYNIIEATFAMNAFGENGPRTDQKISLNLAYSRCLVDEYQTPPIKVIEDARKLVYRLCEQNHEELPHNRLVTTR